MNLLVSKDNTSSHDNVLVLEDVMVPMRDGVALATDIYLPRLASANPSAQFPTLLERTPYDKTGTNRAERTLLEPAPISKRQTAIELANAGYAVVIQDCRGRHNSQGEFTKYLAEAEDGYDTLVWIANQKWCNGKIGMYGLSYGAHVQSAAASLSPPCLGGLLMESGAFYSAFDSGIRQGGAFELKQATWAYRHALVSPETLNDEKRKSTLEEQDIEAWFNMIPWRPGYSPVSAAPEFEAYLFEQWRRGTFDDFWKQKGLYAKGYIDKFPLCPVLYMTGWYDPYALSTLSNFSDLSKRNPETYLIMGPWTHGQRSLSYSGDVDFGQKSIFDNNFEMDFFNFRREWFEYCLNGRIPPLSKKISIFVMGGGSSKKLENGKLDHGGYWRSFDEWPSENINQTTLYLYENGRLSKTNSDNKEHYKSYLFDPLKPVPTIGGAITSGEPVMEAGAFNQIESEEIFGCIAPYRPMAEREDIIIFETEPLKEGVEIIGQIKAKLFVSSNALDTDFTLKLVDVYPISKDYPDGYAMNLSHGILRARFRNGFDKEEFMEEGKIYEIEISGFPTANYFAQGHKIRVEISSSNFPHFDINPNSGEDIGFFENPRPALNKVYFDLEHPSCILLPIYKAK